jgi:hypothetical protein
MRVHVRLAEWAVKRNEDLSPRTLTNYTKYTRTQVLKYKALWQTDRWTDRLDGQTDRLDGQTDGQTGWTDRQRDRKTTPRF